MIDPRGSMNIFKAFAIGILFSSIAATAQQVQAAQQVQTVPYVNLNSFLGSWYEIASIPQFFQRNCVKNTVANYTVDNEGGIDVLNTCINQKGELISANGKAKVFDEKTNAKLSVTFLKIFDWVYTLQGNYWIIDLADDYRYAVIGDRHGTYGWIISRTPRIEEKDLVSAMNALRNNGYDLCRFNITPQDHGSPTQLNLCDISPSN